jgi:Protein of unknown function (DUF3592)
MGSPWGRLRRSVGIESIVWLLLALGIVGFGVKLLVDTRQFLATAAAADGVIVGTYPAERSYDTGGEHGPSVTRIVHLPIVRFTTADDEVVQFRSGTDAAGSRVGASVRVLYDPANPRTARVDSWLTRWVPAVGLILVGLCWIASSIQFELWSLRHVRVYHRYHYHHY